MASVVRRPNGRFEIQFKATNGKRFTVRLGRTTEAKALEFKRRIELIVSAAAMGSPPDPATTTWLAELSPDLRRRIAASGYCEAQPARTVSELCAAFMDWFSQQPGTNVNVGLAAGNLTAFFADRRLELITPTDAEDFRVWLRAHGSSRKQDHTLEETTVSRRCKRARQIFAFAVKKRWLSSNPFGEMRGFVDTNSSRDFYVSLETFAELMEVARDPQIRGIFALSRIGGLRTPSEVLPLTWADVDFSNDWIVVDGKTGLRRVPIFTELRPWIEELHAAAPEGEPLLFPSYQISNSGLAGHLQRTLRRIGIAMWPKPFHNMRASRESDLMDEYPIHVAAAWIGNSPRIALQHYSRIAKHHTDRATGRGAPQNATASKSKESKA